MMMMTAKVDIKKIVLILAGVIGAILLLVLLFGGSDSAQTAAPAVSGNDARVKFLEDFGWDVATSPAQSGQVRIPEEASEIFDRYNALQKSQGYDLNQYAGKTVMRYVYTVNNFPGATDPVYATVLVYKDQIIGGDITNTAAKGVVQGFQRSDKAPQESTPATDAAATESTQESAPAATE